MYNYKNNRNIMSHIISFAQWCQNQDSIQEAALARLRTKPEDLSHSDLVAHSIEAGDMIEFGKETKYRGNSTPKYGLIKGVHGGKVLIQSFSDGEEFFLPTTDLYETDPLEMPAAYYQQLQALGAKRLWKKRTARQRLQDERENKRIAKERAKILPYKAPEITNRDIARIKKILAGGGTDTAQPTQDADPLASLFKSNPSSQEKPQMQSPPLASFRKQQQGLEGRLGNLRFGTN